MIGEVLGNFKIVALLGKGGMGEVWHAVHTTVGSRVAIKTLRSEISAEEDHVKRFFNEAVIAGKIRHAGAVSIFDVGFQAGRAYLVMELLDGETLAHRIRAQGRLPMARVADIGRQIASVLQATHDAGITHRDLKPDNIFLVPDSESEAGERVKVLDFGIAKLGGGVGLTSTSVSSMGTPLYMSPEQWRSVAKVDWRADAYSLGCVAFEMACGHPPFQAQSMGEACAKHLTEPPPAPSSVVPSLPAGFDVLVNRLLDKEPLRRPKMRDVMVAFENLAADRPIELGESHIPTLGSERNQAAETAMASTLVLSDGPPSVATSPTMHASSPGADAVVTRQERGSPGVPRARSELGAAPPSARKRTVVVGGIAAAAAAAFAVTGLVVSRQGAETPDAGLAVASAVDASVPPADATTALIRVDAAVVASKPDRIVSAQKLKRLTGAVPELAIRVPLELCIDAAGAVTHVRMFDDVAVGLVETVTPVVRTWTYRPYLVDGAATAVCINDAIPAKRERVATVKSASAPGSGSGSGSDDDRSKYPEQPGTYEAERAIRFAQSSIDRCGELHPGGGSVRVTYTVDQNGRVQSAEATPMGALGQCVAFALRIAMFPPTRAGFRSSYSASFTKQPPPAVPAP